MEDEVLGLEEETGEGGGLNPPSDEEEEEEGIETDTMIKVIPLDIYIYILAHKCLNIILSVITTLYIIFCVRF